MKFKAQQLALVLLLLFACTIVHAKVPMKHFGINPANLLTTSSSIFVDIFKQATPFYVLKTFNGGKDYFEQDISLLPRNADGYPTSIPPSIHAASDIGTSTFSPNTPYVCLYDGDGEIFFVGDADGTLIAPNKFSLVLNATRSTGRTTLRIKSTNVTNPIRNIRIIPAAVENTPAASELYTSFFLEKMKPFNLLRFTYWQRESFDFSVKREWSTRATPNSQSQAGPHGVSLEYMIQLCNKLNSSAWFSMPREYGVDYLFKFAQMLKDTLNPSLYIYIEYSSNVGLRSLVAQQSLNLFSAFESVFGSQRRSQLVFVVSPRIWEYLPHYETYFNNDFSKVDAIALDGFIGPDLQYEWATEFSMLKNLTEEGVMDLLERSVLNNEVEDNRLYNRMITIGRHLDLITAESGFKLHAGAYGYRFKLQQAIAAKQNITESMKQLAAQEQQLEDLLLKANRNGRLKDIFMDNYRRWRAVGGSSFVAGITESRAVTCEGGGAPCGLRGITESLSAPNSPKYEALAALAKGQVSSLPYTSADLDEEPEPTCGTCVWGACVSGKCQCFEGYSGATCNVLARKNSDCNNGIGINIAGIADWSTEIHFLDVFKSSRQWVSQEFALPGWDTGAPFESDSLGYPKKLPPHLAVGSMMQRDLSGHYVGGTYVVLYDGDGILTFSMADVRAVRRSVGRIEVDVTPTTDPNNGIFLRIERTNPADPVRNIRVITPGYEKTYKSLIFHPMFLESVKNYSHIRFMDFQNTNSQDDKTWADRTLVETRTYQGNGAPVEIMVELANRAGVSAWFCMPHMADDDYITKFATLVFQKLRPDLKVYIEYSNEVWSSNLGGMYAQQQGLLQNLATDGVQARFCYLALRSKQIFAIWKQVFGTANRNRLVFVISSQSVSVDASRRILDCQGAYLEADALAIAPYFGSQDYLTTGITVDKMHNDIVSKAINDTMRYVIAQKDVAKQRNLTLITYESGQHFLSLGDTTLTNVAIETNRDPRMQAAYATYLKELRKHASLISMFGSVGRYSVYGSWGLLEYYDSDTRDAPKYQAVQQFIESTKLCQLTRNMCPSNCSENGVCTDSGKCECFFGYSGEICDQVKYIDNFDCGYKCTFDRGVCVQVGITKRVQREFRCQCKPGYYGYHCSFATCANNCSYAGECTDVNKCECYEGHTGDHCQIDCGCNGHGRCAADNTCICDEGFKYDATAKKCVYDCKCGNPKQTCIGPNECSCLSECVNGICEDGQCKCWKGFTGPSCVEPAASPNEKSPMAMNLGGIADYSTQFVFVDVMKQARTWVPLNRPGITPPSEAYIWDTKDPIEQRPDGYPARLADGKTAATILVRDLDLQYPAGKYVFTYEGEGFFEIGFDAQVTKKRKGRFELQVTPTKVRDNGIFIRIEETNPSNPIRNIKVFMPGFEHKEPRFPFYPEFLRKLERFSAYRFMDWLHVNSPANITFEERATPSYYSQATAKGISYEYIVQLCNINNASPYISIPHTFSTDHVTKLAQFLKQNLRSNLQIYVEHSNEVWNALFLSYAYANKKAAELGLANGHKYHARRSLEIFEAFRSVFGDENRNRLVFVVGTQAVNTWILDQILSYPGAAQTVDAVAIAPYFDCGGLSNNMGKFLQLSIDQIFEECYRHIPTVENMIQKVVNASKVYNVSVMTYEAGPSLLEQGTIEGSGYETPGATDKFVALHRDQRMSALYKRYMESYRKELSPKYPVFHFTSVTKASKYGMFGLLEHIDQNATAAPKFRGALEFIDSVAGKFARKGCNDKNALNYDPSAEENDHSCKYVFRAASNSTTSYSLDKVTMNIPAYGLIEDTQIEIKQVNNLPAPTNAYLIGGTVYRFSPAGLQFSQPVNLCLKLDQVRRLIDRGFVIAHSSDSGETWEMLTSTVNDDDTICAQINSFSYYAIASPSGPSVLPKDSTSAATTMIPSAALITLMLFVAFLL